ncbi:hypothetical protein A0H81_00034 [Grifola frondosa]|uniref:Uncharacterized protein n=1 Tax=Grifola frondosa TaxID=5627 RepID=A0A1C7MWC6_GRIFR|nr:hypothetical protein A0H81_00034 [Grifola frondosa]
MLVNYLANIFIPDLSAGKLLLSEHIVSTNLGLLLNEPVHQLLALVIVKHYHLNAPTSKKLFVSLEKPLTDVGHQRFVRERTVVFVWYDDHR